MSSVNGSGEGHGASVKRVEDPPFLRGARPYTDDLRNPEALYAVFVRSGIAHGTITSIDAAEAKASPGVVGVYTAADLDVLTGEEARRFESGSPILEASTEQQSENCRLPISK